MPFQVPHELPGGDLPYPQVPGPVVRPCRLPRQGQPAFRRHRQQRLFTVHLRRKRHLDENAVDLRPPVQSADGIEQFAGRNRIGRSERLTVDPQLSAGFHLVADINFRSRVVAGKNHGQPGALTRSYKRLHFLCRFCTNV